MEIESIDHSKNTHVIGYIQDFGSIIGLDAYTHEITLYSENMKDVFKVDDFSTFLGVKLESMPSIFQSILNSEVFKAVEQLTKRENETYFDKLMIENCTYHFSIFRTHNTIILEFEKVHENLHKRISNKYDNFYIIDTDKEIWDLLLTTLSNIVNFDRILVYKFTQDGSGKVIAEKNNGTLQQCLGLYYPESDIPLQGRDFYKKKRKRFVRDVTSKEVPLLGYVDEDLDLTFVSSRGVTSLHSKNIKRSGASSSFNISIIVDDKLWGMVNCQNALPQHIDLEDRVQAGVFTVLAANAYSSYKSKKELEYRLYLANQVQNLKAGFLKYSSLFQSLVENKTELRTMPKADGFAIVSDRGFVTDGITPDEQTIERILNWAKGNINESVFYSNSFLKDYGQTLNLDSTAAGIFISFVEKKENEILIWFRKEQEKTINWVGKALPSQESDQKKLSFEVEQKDIKGFSKRWSWKHNLAVQAIRDVILETSHKQNIIIKNLIDQLKKVNEELDTFSYTISHDLGTPLTVMKLNAQMLAKNLIDVSDNNRKKIDTIIAEIDNMAQMMHDVLQLSKAKHSEIILESLETQQTIHKITEDAKLTYNSPHAIIEIENCPTVLSDKTMLHQVFLNIINNAIKYSSQKEIPHIKISGKEENDKVVYIISDNGIGIPEKDKAKMFKTFSRLENAKGFKGNGVGLSIVHRIMQRIGGEVNFESNEEGTSFILTFQKPKLEYQLNHH